MRAAVFLDSGYFASVLKREFDGPGIAFDRFPTSSFSRPVLGRICEHAAIDPPVHAYAMAGTYTLTLRVSDDDGGTVILTMTVWIG